MGMCYYKTGRVISIYLKLLTKNRFVINNTQDFQAMLNNAPISEDKDVSYDAIYKYPYQRNNRFYL